MTHELEGSDEIILDGMRFFTRGGPVSDSNLAVFQNKITEGDYSLDSHPLLSTWIQSDFSGGHGVEEMRSADTNRYKIGTLYTRYPRQISKASDVQTLTKDASWGAGPPARFFVIGDIYVGSTWDLILGVPNAVGGTMLRRLASPATAIGDFPGAGFPTDNGLMYQGLAATTWFLVPFGGGFLRVSLDGAYTFASQNGDATHPSALAFRVWDNKLIALDNVGQFWYTTDPTGAWTKYADTAKIPTGETPKRLERYYDRQGVPALFAVTDRGLWQFDPDDESIFSVDVEFPVHPSQGLASARWGSDLFFSVGLGVHRYSGGTLSAMGLDRDDGLPGEYTSPVFVGSKIIGLVGGYNSMYALVKGPGVATLTMDGVATPMYSSLHEFTGSGWHMIWRKQDASGSEFVERLGPYISQAGSNYRLYWSTSSSGGISEVEFYFIDLPRTFSNPRQKSRSTGGFEPNGFLETGRFNAQMEGYAKTANALDVMIEKIDSSAFLTVKYRVDNASTYTTLGTVTGTGLTTLQFGELREGIYPGVSWQDIQFYYDLTDATANAFIMNYAAFSYIKRRPSQLAWTLQLDLTRRGPGGDSPEVLRAKIKQIIDDGLFVPLVIHQRTYRAFISQDSGADETGLDKRSFRNVSVLEIPQSLSPNG